MNSHKNIFWTFVLAIKNKVAEVVEIKTLICHLKVFNSKDSSSVVMTNAFQMGMKGCKT